MITNFNGYDTFDDFVDSVNEAMEQFQNLVSEDEDLTYEEQ